MKQFLYSSGPTIVASFQNVAYALVSKSLVVDKSSSLLDEHEKSSCPDKKNVAILKLLQSNNCNDEDDVNINEEDKNEKKEKNEDKGLSQSQLAQKEMNTIQAVSSYCDVKKGLLYYAVSRYDKSLSIYTAPIDTKEEDGIDGTKSNEDVQILDIHPIIVHKTIKRCCSLAFAIIPSKDKTTESTIVIAGDLNGDATAYSTESSGVSRVLLGHTASMLTSITIVGEGDHHGTKILTSDRDEKVRVSSFPNCFHVEGYLLGHKSYVSDVKIVPNNVGSSCVTCSGDGTVRLFDYETMQEISMVQIQDTSENDSSGEVNEDKKSIVPLRLAVNNTGTIVAVMYDSFKSIQLYSLFNNGETISLEPAQTIQCPSIPLGIIFSPDGILNVLTTKPNLVRLRCEDDGLFTVVKDEIFNALQSIIEGEQKLVMPTSLLEVDENTGKPKLKKQENKSNEKFVKNEPWLNVERIETYKQHAKRQKRRRDANRQKQRRVEEQETSVIE